MKRRTFIKTSSAAALLASQGALPLLAAERKKNRNRAVSNNCYVEPPAIEPVTGYLPQYAPVATGAMSGAFTARYALITNPSAAAKSRNSEAGTLTVSFDRARCRTHEKRKGTPANIVETSTRCEGALGSTPEWTLKSSVEGARDLDFTERGTWDGKLMTVKAASWTQERATQHPLIARWALLPLLASGRLKKAPLLFDMLDDSALRPEQELRYDGEVEIQVKGGAVDLDSYVQTGQGIVPTHYLVDRKGRVQVITMSYTNWALQDLKVGA